MIKLDLKIKRFRFAGLNGGDFPTLASFRCAIETGKCSEEKEPEQDIWFCDKIKQNSV